MTKRAFIIVFISTIIGLLGAQFACAGWLTNIFKSAVKEGAETSAENATKNAAKQAAKDAAENAAEDATKQTAKQEAKSGATTAAEASAGRVVGGSSAVLGERIGIKKTGEWAAHHLIPAELRNHRVLQKIGMDLDDAANGIALPIKAGVDPKLPLHSGSHPSYTAAAAKELDSIPADLSIEETRRRVKIIQDQLRKKLEEGNPLHTKYGAPDPWY
jgi:hypothetical protein